MFYLCCKITISSMVFELVQEVEINTSWKNFTDTCTIKMPRQVYVKGSNYRLQALNTLIKRGDKVQVELGYNNRYHKQFAGYVAGVKPTTPVEIMCEDEMFKLKQLPVKAKSFKSATVKDVLEYMKVSTIVPYRILGDVRLGTYHIAAEHDTAAKVLKK